MPRLTIKILYTGRISVCMSQHSTYLSYGRFTSLASSYTCRFEITANPAIFCKRYYRDLSHGRRRQRERCPKKIISRHYHILAVTPRRSAWRVCIIGLFRYIKIQLDDSEAVRTMTKESGWYVNIFHIHSNVFLLILSPLPHCQAEYLIFRKWRIILGLKSLWTVWMVGKKIRKFIVRWPTWNFRSNCRIPRHFEAAPLKRLDTRIRSRK